MPLTISWSALRNHEECRQKSKLMATGRRSPTADIRVFFGGTVADRVMRAWLESPNPQSGEMVQMVDAIAETCLAESAEKGEGIVRWRSRDDKADQLAFVRVLVARLEPMLNTLVLPFEYMAEMRFRAVPVYIQGPDGQPRLIHLMGGVDIVTREWVDGVAVWRAYDLKATRDPHYAAKVLGQGIFYDWALRALFGASPVSFGFIQPMVEGSPLVYASITDDDRRSLRARVERMAHAMWRRDWAPKDTNVGCAYCPVQHACPKFTPAPGSGRTLAL